MPTPDPTHPAPAPGSAPGPGSTPRSAPADWTLSPLSGPAAVKAFSSCDHAHAPGESCSHDHARLGQHHPHSDAVCLEHVGYRYSTPTSDGGNAPSGGRNGPTTNTSGSGGGSGGTSGGGEVLHDVTMHVERGANLGIIGPNGGGKSTLVKIIVGLLEGYTGTVTVEGCTPRQACRRGDILGYVPQRLDVEWRFPVTAQQVVTMGLSGKSGLLRHPSRADREYALHMMERVGVADLRDRPIGQLSGGQQQRVFIARALAPRARVLVLDEPLAAVDEAAQQRILQVIRDLHQELGLTIITVSHDIQALTAGCNRVACLRRTVHYHDAPAGLTPDLLREVFEHDVAGAWGHLAPAHAGVNRP